MKACQKKTLNYFKDYTYKYIFYLAFPQRCQNYLACFCSIKIISNFDHTILTLVSQLNTYCFESAVLNFFALSFITRFNYSWPGNYPMVIKNLLFFFSKTGIEEKLLQKLKEIDFFLI